MSFFAAQPCVCNKQCTHVYVGACYYLDNVTLKWQWNTAPLTLDNIFVGQKCNCFLLPQNSKAPTMLVTPTHFKTNTPMNTRAIWTVWTLDGRMKTASGSCQLHTYFALGTAFHWMLHRIQTGVRPHWSSRSWRKFFQDWHG